MILPHSSKLGYFVVFGVAFLNIIDLFEIRISDSVMTYQFPLY